MSQNRYTGGEAEAHGTGAADSAGTGATNAGTTRDTSTGLTTGSDAVGGYGTTTGAPPMSIAEQAREYGQKVADASSTAKDYLSDKASVAADKITDLRNMDYRQMAEDAKEYARQKPGQTLLISAAAGFVMGLLLRGGRTSARPPGDPTTPPPPPRKRR